MTNPRVSDSTLATICAIIAKTAGPLPGEEHTHGDNLRECALDLRDLRAASLAPTPCASCARWKIEAELLVKAMPPPESLRRIAVWLDVFHQYRTDTPIELRASADAIEAALAEYGVFKMGYERIPPEMPKPTADDAECKPRRYFAPR